MLIGFVLTYSAAACAAPLIRVRTCLLMSYKSCMTQRLQPCSIDMLLHVLSGIGINRSRRGSTQTALLLVDAPENYSRSHILGSTGASTTSVVRCEAECLLGAESDGEQ